MIIWGMGIQLPNRMMDFQVVCMHTIGCRIVTEGYIHCYVQRSGLLIQ